MPDEQTKLASVLFEKKPTMRTGGLIATKIRPAHIPMKKAGELMHSMMAVVMHVFCPGCRSGRQ